MNVLSEPIFAVADVVAAVAYYRDTLGFARGWLWTDPGTNSPPSHGGVWLGNAHIMFSLQPQLAARAEGFQHSLRVDDVQSLYDRHKAAGAQILHPLENKPWGLREYTVRDLTGYHLRFGGDPTYQRPAAATEHLPAHISIEPRLASIDEYERLADAVGWNKDRQIMQTALEHTRLGVVAIDTRDRQAVGMLRVCGDGRHFTIWDVIVQPSHQGQKIGTAMMERALADLKPLAPKGAMVGLFTGKPAFYERLGFAPGGGMQRTI